MITLCSWKSEYQTRIRDVCRGFYHVGFRWICLFCPMLLCPPPGWGQRVVNRQGEGRNRQLFSCPSYAPVIIRVSVVSILAFSNALLQHGSDCYSPRDVSDSPKSCIGVGNHAPIHDSSKSCWLLEENW